MKLKSIVLLIFVIHTPFVKEDEFVIHQDTQS